MADDLRIYELADSQVSYDPDIELAVDDSGFSNTKKMPVSVIYPKTNTLDAAGNFNPDTTLLRTDNNSGEESKLTITNMFADTDVQAIIKLIGNTGWKTYLAGDIVKNSSKVDAGTFVCNAISSLGVVTITGTLKMNTQAAQNEVLFTLPSSIPTATKNIYFAACDDGSNDENLELYIPATTRTILIFTNNSSTQQLSSFCVTFLAI